MNLLFHILRAGHASGTHHKLALDALAEVGGPYAERWQRLILAHGPLYLEGSKAPDNQFKDFKNHVLHVREKMWGGAREKAVNWYQHLVSAIRDGNWGEAAWCAGVLSHYYTDPIMPFHTGQTAAENSIHRACEWSIARSYETLARMGEKTLPTVQIAIKAGDGWLEDLIEQGARRSNAHYETLLTHYDIHRGVVDPPAGLDAVAQALIAELLRYAALTYARVLERAFAESAVVPPEVSLTAETLLATIKLPIKAVLKRIDDRHLRLQVEAIFDELQATGRVEKALPEDERVVRALHAKEVLGKPVTSSLPEGAAPVQAQVERGHRPGPAALQAVEDDPEEPKTRPVVARRAAVVLPPTPPAPPVNDVAPRRSRAVSPQPVESAAIETVPVPEAPAPGPEAGVTPTAVAAAVTTSAPPASSEPAPVQAAPVQAAPSEPASVQPAMGLLGAMSSLAGRLASIGPKEVLEPVAAATESAEPAKLAARPVDASSHAGAKRYEPKPHEAKTHASVPHGAKPATDAPAVGVRPSGDVHDDRIYLTPAQDVVDAPSIGPKTADRMKAVGINTVADLFAADPGALAEQLNVPHIRAKTIAEWQDQARLVCEIPGLRGTHAQLLVGAGYRDLRKIARAEARQLSVDVLRFVQTSEGQRILRSGGVPDLEKIISWVHAAERVYTAKAA